MSTEATVAFFGIRIDVPESEVEQLELRRHPLISRARSASLQFYWGNFGGVEPKYLFMIGKKLAVLGLEDSSEFRMPSAQLMEVMEDFRNKLRAAGFEQEPELILQVLSSP